MRPRLAAVYVLLVLLPLGILGWLGLKLAQEEHVNKQNDLQQLMQQGLTRLDDTIARVIENLEMGQEISHCKVRADWLKILTNFSCPG